MAEAYFNVAGGESRLSRTDGSGEEDYAVLQSVLGLRLKLPILLQSDWQPSLLLEAGYNRLSGDGTTLGSYKNLVFIEAGYHQPLWKYGFAALKAGVGVSDNHFNFGEGSIPLPSEIGAPLLLNARLGVEYCFAKSPCVNVFAEPFYERNLVRSPDYHAYGAVGGLGVAFDLSPTVSADEYRRLEEDRNAWRKKAELPAVVKADPEEKPVVVVQPPPELPVVVVQPCSDSPKIPTTTELLAQDPVASTVILFPNESDRMPLFPNSQLDLVVRDLKKNQGMGVIIHGHANETGSEKLNERLSSERANRVKRYLEGRGVPARQLVDTKGHGSSKPINPQDPKDPMNRAVVFEKVKLQ